jgi:hypothetical protein
MKQVITSLVMFIASFVLLIGVVFAWFTVSNENSIQPINNSVISREVNLGVEYGINGGSYFSFNDPAEINAYLNNMLPGDFINIRVTAENSNAIGAEDVTIDIMLRNIRSTETEIPYDLTDFFSIYQGIITVTWYDSLEDYVNNIPLQSQNINLIQYDTNIIGYEGRDLEMNRLSNLFNREMVGEELVIENNIDILNTTFSSGQIIVIEFSIGFDPYTPDQGIGFQDGELLIDGLYTYFGDEEE